MSNAILRHKIGEGAYRDYELSNPVTTIGRSSSNDIVINDTSLSRLHIRVENRNGTFYLIDNNSSNGTFLNRRKITEAPLKSGDTVMAGRVYFYFVFKDEVGLTEELTEPATVSIQRFTPEPDSGPSDEISPDFLAGGQPEAPVPVPPPPPVAPSDMASGSSGDSPPPLKFQAPPPAPTPAEPSSGRTSKIMPAVAKSAVGTGTGERSKPMKRFLAYLIDWVCVMVAYLPGVAITFLVSETLGGLINLVVGLAALAYFPFAWHKYGKTLGKHVMKIRVIETGKAGGGGIELKAAILRTLGYLICGITCGLGFLYIFFNEEGLGIQDKIAGTEVIDEN